MAPPKPTGWPYDGVVTIDLARIHTLAEFEASASRAMEPAAFDYVAGGAWDEVSLLENVVAWRRYQVMPRVLVDVATIDPSTTMLGRPVAMPVAIAPMAVHALAHPSAEIATAKAAAEAGIPFSHSTMGSRSIEDVAAAAPAGLRWFQLYTQADPGRTRELVARAEAGGFGAIVLTVDLPRLGYRQRDRRSGFTLSGLGNFTDAPPTHAAGIHAAGLTLPEGLLGVGLTWADLDTIRGWTGLPLVLKGILSADDARIALEHDVAAIVVSNHGARQLDRTPAPIDVLAEVIDAVDGRLEVWVDGGVRRGLDVAIARALGAQGVLVGRPIIWALATAGQAGVARALAILREEFEIALALLGTPTPSAITRAHVRAPSSLRSGA
jgi:isopentenyl diphosphate isomerase/L-lactate dehydrogenase-like FMN-dependent dehydrogenase